MAIEKRFPSDFRDQTDTKTMLSDTKVDMQLYNLLQCNSMPYPIKDEGGKVIDYETRVYKKDLPTQEEMAEMFSVSLRTITTRWGYLLKSSKTNKFCPYLEKHKDKNGIYYVILNKERNFIMVPLEICNYLKHGYSSLAIRIYNYLFARDNYIKYLGGGHYIFTLTGLAKRLGIENPRENIWSWPDAPIPQALIALQTGKLIEFERKTENNRNFYILKSITKDLTEIKALLPKPTKMTEEDKRDATLSEVVDLIIDNGSPDYDKKIHAQKAHNAIKKLEEIAGREFMP